MEKDQATFYIEGNQTTSLCLFVYCFSVKSVRLSVLPSFTEFTLLISFSFFLSLIDMKSSPGGASVGKTSSLLLGQQCDGAPLGAVTRPEVEMSNMVMSSRLSSSQASLHSNSSVGSVRGDEGGPYSDFYGEYYPLFNNPQDLDSTSLRGGHILIIILLLNFSLVYSAPRVNVAEGLTNRTESL